jgi:hypothetical protein
MNSTVAAAAATTATTAWWVAPGIIAALIAAAVALITLTSQTHRARVDRHRELLAEANAAISDYCEYPFIIRRRADGDAERSRISKEFSSVQQRINHHQALILVEAPTVAQHYDHLAAETRRIAGAACHDSWNRPVLAPDESANVTDIDLSALSPAKDAYVAATRRHLHPIRTRIEEAWRWIAGRWKRNRS